jgi:hypothetical protein
MDSKCSETLSDDRSSKHKHLREVSISDLAYSLLDLNNTKSPNHPLPPENHSSLQIDDRDVMNHPRKPQIDE